MRKILLKLHVHIHWTQSEHEKTEDTRRHGIFSFAVRLFQTGINLILLIFFFNNCICFSSNCGWFICANYTGTCWEGCLPEPLHIFTYFWVIAAIVGKFWRCVFYSESHFLWLFSWPLIIFQKIPHIFTVCIRKPVKDIAEEICID